jgi:hypothetical protein
MKTTSKVMITFVVLSMMTILATNARADWDPGQDYKMHWPQLPDLQPTGMDVWATYPYPSATGPLAKVLADDFLCTETGPITDIHIWGSWLNNIYPTHPDGTADPAAVSFKLSIHADIPAVTLPGGTVAHSRPGELLWEDYFTPGDPRLKTRLYATGVQEQFYDPNIDQIIGDDNEVWQHNFLIDPATAFLQKGTATDPKVYWLDVLAVTDPIAGITPAVWGWKTSRDHWNDDAVFGDTTDPFGVPTEWNELRYPSSHPLGGESIDLAFVITPEPATLAVLALGAIAGLIRRRK